MPTEVYLWYTRIGTLQKYLISFPMPVSPHVTNLRTAVLAVSWDLTVGMLLKHVQKFQFLFKDARNTEHFTCRL
jgi:hypothetical protein